MLVNNRPSGFTGFYIKNQVPSNTTWNYDCCFVVIDCNIIALFRLPKKYQRKL